MKTTKKLFVSILLLFLLSGNLLKAQDYENVKVGLLDIIYVFNGVFYELYEIKPLNFTNVEVSSTLNSNSGRYQKAHLSDKNPKTAWVEGVKGNGIGQKIRFTFENSSPPDVISFIPGYMKSEETWYKNNRVSKFKVTILTAENSHEPNEFIGEITVSIPKDSKSKVNPDTYSVNISSIYLQNMASEFFGTVEIEILEVDSKDACYEDTCISEISFYIADKSKSKGKISYEEYQEMFKNND